MNTLPTTEKQMNASPELRKTSDILTQALNNYEHLNKIATRIQQTVSTHRSYRRMPGLYINSYIVCVICMLRALCVIFQGAKCQT